MTAIDRLPPHDLEAEEAVVACCLVSPDTIPETAAMLSGADFFCEKNGWIFDAEQAVYNRDGGAGVNQFTVAHELARLNLLEPAGGQAYLADVVRRLPTSLGSEFYAKIVKDTGTMRKLISAGSAIAQLAYRAGDDVAGEVEQPVRHEERLPGTRFRREDVDRAPLEPVEQVIEAAQAAGDSGQRERVVKMLFKPILEAVREHFRGGL